VGRGRRRPVTRCEDLEARDREVLRLLASGNTNQEIAREIGVTEPVVNNMLRSRHSTSILQKIGVDSRADAIVWYTRNCGQDQEESLFSLYRGILTAFYISVIIFLFLPLYLYTDVNSLPYIYSDLNLVVPAIAGIYGLAQVRGQLVKFCG
jgi:DNA-binding CsgD family transcriptional regulator